MPATKGFLHGFSARPEEPGLRILLLRRYLDPRGIRAGISKGQRNMSTLFKS